MSQNLRKFLSKVSMEMNIPRKQAYNIIVEGNVGSGKTSFLNYFKGIENVEIHSEPIHLWRNCGGHNLLKLQYETPKTWSYLLQSYIQLTMMQIHLQESVRPIKIVERSIFSARYFFVECMIRDQIMVEPATTILDEWYKFLIALPTFKVDLIVYLRTSPKIVYERTKQRDRSEEKNIKFEFMQKIHDLHEEWFVDKANALPAELIIIDGNMNEEEFRREFRQFEAGIPEASLLQN